MPFVHAGTCASTTTSRAAEAPVLVLSHSLGADRRYGSPQMPALAKRFRVLRYDIARTRADRGHAAGPCTDRAAGGGTCVRLLDALGVARAHFCGLSIGGQVGMWLGAHAPERIDRLVLCNTGRAHRHGRERGTRASKTVRDARDVACIAAAVMERWFTAGFRRASPQAVARARAMLESTSRRGLRGQLRGHPRRGPARRPRGDPGAHARDRRAGRTPRRRPADGRSLAGAIPGARYVELDAAHLSNIEAAGALHRRAHGVPDRPDGG